MQVRPMEDTAFPGRCLCLRKRYIWVSITRLMYFFGSKIDHIRPGNKAEPKNKRKIAIFSFYLILIVAFGSFSPRFDHKEKDAERIENPKNRNKS